MGYNMDKLNIENKSMVELTKKESILIYGGNKPGTFADEIGYFVGRMWRDMVTSFQARARGQILSH